MNINIDGEPNANGALKLTDGAYAVEATRNGDLHCEILLFQSGAEKWYRKEVSDGVTEVGYLDKVLFHGEEHEIVRVQPVTGGEFIAA